ncbi:MAG: PDZ domain-containing protein, partial [Chthoniobacteraceae bacterium]
MRVQGGAGIVQANAIPAGLEQPPVIFFPGIPSILLPNPLAKADTRPGFLGVQLDTDGDAQADDDIAKNGAAKKITGVGITSVIEDSPAAKAGLKDGDRVLTLDGKEAK